GAGGGRGGQEGGEGVADAGHAGQGLVGGLVVELDGGGVDDAAGRDHEVGRPDDAAIVEEVGGGGGGGLVGGRAGARLAAEQGHGLRREQATQGGRHQDIDLGSQCLVGRDPGGAQFLGELSLALIDIGDHQLGSLGGEPSRDQGSHMPQTYYREPMSRHGGG